MRVTSTLKDTFAVKDFNTLIYDLVKTQFLRQCLQRYALYNTKKNTQNSHVVLFTIFHMFLLHS